MRKLEYILLGLVIVGAVLLRILPQLSQVFVDGQVWYRGNDTWYHMRLADNLMYNWPKPLTFDMYLAFPNGSKIGFTFLLSWIIVGISKLTGVNYELVGAYLPPIAAGLTLLGVYGIGRVLINGWVGILAALIAGLIPGEFFHRSLLGFPDHHVLESLFSTYTILFVLLALKRQRLVWVVPAGVSTGLFLLNWTGGILLVFILLSWFLLHFSYNVWKDLSTLFLCKLLVITLIIAYLVHLPINFINRQETFYLFALYSSLVIPLLLYFLAQGVSKKLYFIILGCFLVGSTLGVKFLIPDLWYYAVSVFNEVFWGYFGSPIQEGLPSDWYVISNIYGLVVIPFFAGLYFSIKNKLGWLFIVWTIIITLAAVGKRRWGYYFTINIGLMSAIGLYYVSQVFKKQVRVGVLVILLAFTLFPNIKGTLGIAYLPNNINSDWYSALTWLGKNSPESFKTQVYNELNPHEKPYYGVLTWWDYGHWITRVSKRVPTSNPAFWGNMGIYRWFMAQSEEEAERWIKGFSIRYIVLDSAVITTKWPTLVELTGSKDPASMWKTSMAYKLYSEELTERYRLVYRGTDVKIFEKIK